MDALREMITFDRSGVRFTCRIVGVALDQVRRRVLLHQAEGDEFWSLPGGRAELLEPATATLVREMREEIGVAVTVDRLLWVVENFFIHRDRHHHELGLYFLIAFPPDSPLYRHDAPFFGQEGALRLIFRWFPLAALDQIVLYPTFLVEGLRALPVATTHVVHHDPGA